MSVVELLRIKNDSLHSLLLACAERAKQVEALPGRGKYPNFSVELILGLNKATKLLVELQDS